MHKTLAFVPIFFSLALLCSPLRIAAQAGVKEQSSTVVINEIMYAPHSPEPEWIELFNTDSTAIDLTNWEIATGSKTDSIPAITIPGLGYLVLSKDSIALITARPGTYNLRQMPMPDLDNTGSELILRNDSIHTVDSLYYLPSWGGSTGASLERRNALASSTDPGNWGTSIASSGATPGMINSLSVPDTMPALTPAHPLDLVINEIMFAPVSPEPEWMELLNTTNDTIDIGGWTLTVQGHVPVTIPSTNTLIAPDSLMVLSSNDAELASFRHIPEDRIVLFSLPSLSNSGSTLALRDPLGNLIDSAYYDGSWIKKDGISIERINPASVGYDASNWGACTDSSGSTILRPNSIRIRDYDLALSDERSIDSSIQVTIINIGLDTVHTTSVALQIGPFTPVVQQISTVLANHDSLIVSFPLPDNFYGLFPATAYIVGSLNENPTSDTLHFSVVKPIPQDSVVINELMFDPQPAGCEWMELYNLSNQWISLDSTQLLTGESRPGEYTHIIPPLVIAPDSFGLVAANGSIYTTYPALTGKRGIASLGTSTLDLGKDSCFVVLYNVNDAAVDNQSSFVDSVHYFKSWQQSLLTKTFVGISLERKNPRGASNDPGNWQASLDSATPLAQNSVSVNDSNSTTTPPAGPLFTASFSPNPFSPDGDGIEDVSMLSVQTGNGSQWVMRVRIYDGRGREVRLLTDATSVYRSMALSFDGKRDNGLTLPPGLYTVLVELTSQSPVQTLTQTTGVVIAGKRK